MAAVDNIFKIRLANVKRIIEGPPFEGVVARFAETIGRQPAYVSRLFTDNPEHRRNIGEALARDIERILGLPDKSLDLPPASFTGIGLTPNVGRAVTNNIHPTAVPVLAWGATAKLRSEGMGSIDKNDVLGSIATPVHTGPNTFALYVEGVSMEPRFRAGDIILVDPDVTPVHQSFVIVANGEETVFRQLVIEGKRRLLKAVNPSWPDPLTDLGEATIIGTVIFRMEKL